jgi:hypothetical protein
MESSGGSPPPADTTPTNTALSESACRDIATSAQLAVQPTITSNLACKLDSDCDNVRFAASCFDACTTILATAGAAALQAAIDRVEAAQCVRYHKGGCTSIAPPCVPPTPALCGADGTCTRIPR